MGASHQRAGLDRRDFLKSVAASAMGLGLAGAASRELLAKEEEGASKPRDSVATRPLGRTGIRISVVAYGCGGVREDHLPLLEAALDRGINYFDTASGYRNGESERVLGLFVREVKDRERIIIATKASGLNTRGAAKEVYGRLREKLEGSLERLKTDYVDVMFAPHGASSPGAARNQATHEALERLRSEKLIRHFATSSHAKCAETCLAAIQDGFYEVLLPVANLATQNGLEPAAAPSGRQRGRPIDDTREMLLAAKRKKVGIIAMKAANPGFFPLTEGKLAPDAEKALAKTVPASEGLSLHQRLYTYILKQPGVSAVLIGIGNLKHLKEAIAVGCAM